MRQKNLQTPTTGQVKDVSLKHADGLNAIHRTPPENPQTSTFGKEKHVSPIPADVLNAMPRTPPDAYQIPVGLAVIPWTPPEGPRKPMVIPRTPPGGPLKSKAGAPMAEHLLPTPPEDPRTASSEARKLQLSTNLGASPKATRAPTDPAWTPL